MLTHGKAWQDLQKEAEEHDVVVLTDPEDFDEDEDEFEYNYQDDEL